MIKNWKNDQEYDKQPLVSICIPTYNRAKYLAKTIESIIIQQEFTNGEVEIIVSDNASEDSTLEVCKKYTAYPNFYYFRNNENIHDKNFPKVLSEAHGKLRKLNNDTFVHSNNSLKKLCLIEKKYDKSRPFLFLRNIERNDRNQNFREFVLDAGYWTTWISGFLIWEDECNNIETDTEGCELKLWQTKKAYEIAVKSEQIVTCYKRIGETVTPPKKDITFGVFKVFYCNYLSILNSYYDLEILTKEDIDYLEKNVLLGYFPKWVVLYELNNTDMQYSKEENLKDAVYKQYKDKPYWGKFVRICRIKRIKIKIRNLLKL